MSRSHASLLSALLLVATSVVHGQGASPSAQATAAGNRAAASIPAAALPADYVIGEEDVLGVLFWREQDMSGDVAVRPDGRITLPLIGEVVASGKTPEALRTEIQDAAGKYLSDPNVTLLIRQMNSRKVYITGAVTNPGSFPLNGPRTVMQLISLAGGLTEFADAENITVIRPDKTGASKALKFNYKDVAKGRRLEQNVVLQPGDTVVVDES
jgi:polysaccharide export outer membrane protein